MISTCSTDFKSFSQGMNLKLTTIINHLLYTWHYQLSDLQSWPPNSQVPSSTRLELLKGMPNIGVCRSRQTNKDVVWQCGLFQKRLRHPFWAQKCEWRLETLLQIGSKPQPCLWLLWGLRLGFSLQRGHRWCGWGFPRATPGDVVLRTDLPQLLFGQLDISIQRTWQLNCHGSNMVKDLLNLIFSGKCLTMFHIYIYIYIILVICTNIWANM